AGFVLVTRILVDVRRREDGVTLDLGGQRDRAAHLRAGPLGRFDDLAGRTVDQPVIERLEPDPDFLVRHDGIPSLKERRARRLGAPDPVSIPRPPDQPRPDTLGNGKKSRADRFPDPPRPGSQACRNAPPMCPGDLRNGRSTCHATRSLSGENEALPAPHFAVPLPP